MKKEDCELSFPKYQALLSIDLRCFDLRQPDYGVRQYFETLGFLPHILMYHETNLDQVHLHDGIIDETKLDYMWITQRGMPGGQIWTRRQLRELVDEVHKYGVKFYQGFEASWQAWPQYFSKSKWPYEHDELFITYKDGRKSNEGEMATGPINPLVRMKDGTFYEDLLCKALIQYLNDYNMDGFFSGDGMAGLTVTLEVGDYSDDMIEQFTTFSKVEVKGSSTSEKSNYIWTNLRREWTSFYVERWVKFYKKLSQALKSAGKGLSTMDAWARSPGDSVVDFGFDYLRMNEAGLDYYCMESREENWGRRGHSALYAWEVGQVLAVATIKARAPDLTLLWALCSANAPENWHALRDVPIVLERQLMTLPLTSHILPNGDYKRSYDGYLAIFGIDLNRAEWDWMNERMDFSFHPEVKRILGPALIWSDPVFEEKMRNAERWNVVHTATELSMAGLPVRSAVNTKNLKNAKAESYVLVDSTGITKPEVDALLKKVDEGADLILIGDIGNDKLLEKAGLKEVNPISAKTWAVTASLPTQFGKGFSGNAAEEMTLRYVANTGTGASVFIVNNTSDNRVVFSRRDFDGSGSVFYIPGLRGWKKSIIDAESMSGFTEKVPGLGNASYMSVLVNEIMPNTLELLLAALLKYKSGISVSVDTGPYLAYETENGDVVVHLENTANFFYSRPKITTNFDIAGIRHFPIRTSSPAGYIIDRSTHSRGCQVNVLPDGVIPLLLIRKK